MGSAGAKRRRNIRIKSKKETHPLRVAPSKRSFTYKRGAIACCVYSTAPQVYLVVSKPTYDLLSHVDIWPSRRIYAFLVYGHQRSISWAFLVSLSSRSSTTNVKSLLVFVSLLFALKPQWRRRRYISNCRNNWRAHCDYSDRKSTSWYTYLTYVPLFSPLNMTHLLKRTLKRTHDVCSIEGCISLESDLLFYVFLLFLPLSLWGRNRHLQPFLHEIPLTFSAPCEWLFHILSSPLKHRVTLLPTPLLLLLLLLGALWILNHPLERELPSACQWLLRKQPQLLRVSSFESSFLFPLLETSQP